MTVVKADAKPRVGTAPAVVSEGVNYELLDYVLKYIKENPQTWTQNDWFQIYDRSKNQMVPHLVDITYEEINSCGSAFCFAGHAALVEGFPAPPKTNFSPWERNVDGEIWPESAAEFARKRLGLTGSQADVLFHPSNELEDLELIISRLKVDPAATGDELESDLSWTRDEDEDDDSNEDW